MDPKTYTLSVHCANEWFDEAPDRAKVEITPEFAKRIVALSKLVKANDWYCVEQWSYLPVYGWTTADWTEDAPDEETRWDHNGEFRTDFDRMIVSDYSVWFECYPKHVDNADISTDGIQIKDLAQDFGIPLEDK